MSRKYRHLKEYEKELIEHINQGHTLRETGEKSMVYFLVVLCCRESKKDSGYRAQIIA